MNADVAYDWLKLLVEVSVGVYVFYISVPALMYGTLIPQELRDLRSTSNARLLRPSFKAASICVFIIVLLSYLHFFVTQWHSEGTTPQFVSQSNADGAWITANTGTFSLFSTIVVILVSLVFIILLISGYAFMQRCVRIQQGRIKMFIENLKGDIIYYYGNSIEQNPQRPGRPWNLFSRFSRPRAPDSYTEADYWNEMQLLGRYALPGRQKHIWIMTMAEIIAYLAEHHKQDESLKQAISTLGEVMGDESHICPYENIKDTLNIYRSLLNRLKSDAQPDQLDRFSDCLAAISNDLLGFFQLAIYNKEPELLPNIISTVPYSRSFVYLVQNLPRSPGPQ